MQTRTKHSTRVKAGEEKVCNKLQANYYSKFKQFRELDVPASGHFGINQ